LLLSEVNAGNSYEICRLYSSEKDFFDFCASNHIVIGSTIKVEKQYDSGKMTEIKVNRKTILLAREFTSVIYVKQTINN
jgi:DtxR family Mn-dependent transcriptional regulator